MMRRLVAAIAALGLLAGLAACDLPATRSPTLR
jgi:hypothetical protein